MGKWLKFEKLKVAVVGMVVGILLMPTLNFTGFPYVTVGDKNGYSYENPFACMGLYQAAEIISKAKFYGVSEAEFLFHEWVGMQKTDQLTKGQKDRLFYDLQRLYKGQTEAVLNDCAVDVKATEAKAKQNQIVLPL